MLEKLKELIKTLNSKGIPLPMLTDPKTGIASVSLTMLFISFNVVLVGLVGKWSKMLDGIDLSQAMTWFGICTSLYFGRSFATKNKDGNTLDVTQKEEGKKDE